VRAVLDPNVLIAALLSRSGAPARLVSHWLAGAFELVVSETLLAELKRALRYPKLRAHISPAQAAGFVALLRADAILAPDPPTPRSRSADPDDNYLPALAESRNAVLVSGDQHLLVLADVLPVMTTRAFLETIEKTKAPPI
jgi:putative PIN family toxin of toxin-antitoxin system